MDELDLNGLTGYRDWVEAFQPTLDAEAFMAEHLSIPVAAAFLNLVFPRLIEVRGCLLRAARYEPDNFEEWWASTDGSPTAVESALNHLHLWDLFEPGEEPEERALAGIAERIAEGWRVAALRQFPDRQVLVEVTEGYGPTVTLLTQR